MEIRVTPSTALFYHGDFLKLGSRNLGKGGKKDILTTPPRAKEAMYSQKKI